MLRRAAVPVVAAFLAVAAGCAPVKPLIIQQAIGPFDAAVLVHSAYNVLTPEGTVVQEVPNHGTLADREPTPVSLPAGKYKVVARESHYGTVSLLAVIEAGRKTVIDLNEEVVPSRSTREQNWVRLPSGQVVGRTAN
jgi:hypothetical protein